jgi:putative copper export protein
MSLLTAVLVGLHIFSAVGWLGGLLAFRLVLTPLMPKLSASTRGELVVKLFPRFVVTVISFGGMTVVFGILLAFTLITGDPSQFAFNNAWGMRIMTGAAVALIVLLLGVFVTYPSVKKMAGMLTEMMAKNQQAPPPEFGKLQKRVAMVANVGLILLVVTLIFMVSAVEL